jgi:hypothetical protein
MPSRRRFSPSSKARLTRHDLGRFAGTTLFDRIARAVCAAGCLPRKELYECWEVGRRTRRLFRGGRVIDIAGGHGLLAQLLLLLDDSSPGALVVDPQLPTSAERVHEALARAWPRLAHRVSFIAVDAGGVEIGPDDLVVSCHACGALTDRVIEAGVRARARVSVLPCCHDAETCDTGGLAGWMDAPLAIDATRVARLRAHGYVVRTQLIPEAIIPKNRLILAEAVQKRRGPTGPVAAAPHP